MSNKITPRDVEIEENITDNISEFDSGLIPSGGFPPIYLCTNTKIQAENKNKEKKTKREYEVNKNSITIKSILEQRRKKSSFI
jgi:hypothetical protein